MSHGEPQQIKTTGVTRDIEDLRQPQVPVIVDGKTSMGDFWKIAKYLEATYPDKPSLFGGPGGWKSPERV